MTKNTNYKEVYRYFKDGYLKLRNQSGGYSKCDGYCGRPKLIGDHCCDDCSNDTGHSDNCNKQLADEYNIKPFIDNAYFNDYIVNELIKYAPETEEEKKEKEERERKEREEKERTEKEEKERQEKEEREREEKERQEKEERERIEREERERIEREEREKKEKEEKERIEREEREKKEKEEKERIEREEKERIEREEREKKEKEEKEREEREREERERKERERTEREERERTEKEEKERKERESSVSVFVPTTYNDLVNMTDDDFKKLENNSVTSESVEKLYNLLEGEKLYNLLEGENLEKGIIIADKLKEVLIKKIPDLLKQKNRVGYDTLPEDIKKDMVKSYVDQYNQVAELAKNRIKSVDLGGGDFGNYFMKNMHNFNMDGGQNIDLLTILTLHDTIKKKINEINRNRNDKNTDLILYFYGKNPQMKSIVDSVINDNSLNDSIKESLYEYRKYLYLYDNGIEEKNEETLRNKYIFNRIKTNYYKNDDYKHFNEFLNYKLYLAFLKYNDKIKELENKIQTILKDEQDKIHDYKLNEYKTVEYQIPDGLDLNNINKKIAKSEDIIKNVILEKKEERLRKEEEERLRKEEEERLKKEEEERLRKEEEERLRKEEEERKRKEEEERLRKEDEERKRKEEERLRKAEEEEKRKEEERKRKEEEEAKIQEEEKKRQEEAKRQAEEEERKRKEEEERKRKEEEEEEAKRKAEGKEEKEKASVTPEDMCKLYIDSMTNHPDKFKEFQRILDRGHLPVFNNDTNEYDEVDPINNPAPAGGKRKVRKYKLIK